MVEASVGQFQAECIFTVNTTPNRIRGLAVREPFRELKHRRKSQSARRFCGLSTLGKQTLKLLVLVHAAQHISDAKTCTTLRKRCQSYSPRLVRNAESLLWSERHASILRTPPAKHISDAKTCTTLRKRCQSYSPRLV